MICEAMIDEPKKVATRLGNLSELAYSVAPGTVDRVLNYADKRFPDSLAARGGGGHAVPEPTSDSVAFAHILRGVHW